MTITVVESNTVEAVTEAVALKVNSKVPHRLASFFYINKKNKISYYRKDAWGSLETWNTGSSTWEYSPGMNDATLIKLPACAFKTPVEAVVEVTKVTTGPALLSQINSHVSRTQKVPDINSTSVRHPILEEAEKLRISERAKELARIAVEKSLTNSRTTSQPSTVSPYIVKQDWKLIKTSLTHIIERHNVHKYPTHFVEGENNYAFAYIYEKGLWEIALRVNFLAGITTVASKTCALAVVKELNDLGIKPDQVN